jgi:hypothetical protein
MAGFMRKPVAKFCLLGAVFGFFSKVVLFLQNFQGFTVENALKCGFSAQICTLAIHSDSMSKFLQLVFS